jgi:hypothetical protein
MKLSRTSASRLLRWFVLLVGVGVLASGCSSFTPGKSSIFPQRSKPKQRSRDDDEPRSWFGWRRQEPQELKTVDDWLKLEQVRPWEPAD